MRESQAFSVLLGFLTGFDRRSFRSVLETMTPDQGGTTSLPEAVELLLRSFATNNAIKNAVVQLRDVKQLPKEDEKNY